mmetsp:Transcript_15779/g.22192  ORF Transcript_15779/g.22192 Transcript_15779/m.22192 type:complete len:265 (+) Transcript_15779:220-1014(+)
MVLKNRLFFLKKCFASHFLFHLFLVLVEIMSRMLLSFDDRCLDAGSLELLLLRRDSFGSRLELSALNRSSFFGLQFLREFCFRSFGHSFADRFLGQLFLQSIFHCCTSLFDGLVERSLDLLGSYFRFFGSFFDSFVNMSLFFGCKFGVLFGVLYMLLRLLDVLFGRFVHLFHLLFPVFFSSFGGLVCQVGGSFGVVFRLCSMMNRLVVGCFFTIAGLGGSFRFLGRVLRFPRLFAFNLLRLFQKFGQCRLDLLGFIGFFGLLLF